MTTAPLLAPIRRVSEDAAEHTDISVCFASRGRPDSMLYTIRLLLGLAAQPDRIDFTIAVDPDDESVHKVRRELPDNVQLWIAPERYGYTQLHRYLNPIALAAQGTWTMWWNDDAVMRTEAWDLKVKQHPREAILWPQANHAPWAMLFPVWPTRWIRAAGMVTPVTEMDTWLQRVGERLDALDKIQVHVLHDRFDQTGHHDDATYREGRALFGSDGMITQQFPYHLLDDYCAKIEEVRTRG